MAHSSCLGNWFAAKRRSRAKCSFFLLFFHFLKYFNLVLDYFFDFKNKVVCCRVSILILFYLMSQNNELFTRESENFKAKNWREG